MIRALVAICCVVACTSPPPKSVRGYVAVTDRAEVAGAVAFADGIVVRTEGGNLVRYDRALQFTGDGVPPSPVSALVAVDGTLYAGLENGDIGRLDARLGFEAIAHVDGTPHWIGKHGGDLLVAANRKLVRIRDGEPRTLELAFDRPRGKPNVLLDGDTLWWGIDAGEWGGVVGRVDLVAFTSTPFEGSDQALREPVHGFVKHRERVLRYGGLAHMGSEHGTIASVDASGVHELWRRSYSPRYRQVDPPGWPVHAMLADGDHFIVVLGHEIYETDLKTWKRRATLPDHARTVALVDLRDALVIATSVGLFTLRGSKLARVTP